jgi:hypothetical protein
MARVVEVDVADCDVRRSIVIVGSAADRGRRRSG